jgi:aspartate aminotransferase
MASRRVAAVEASVTLQLTARAKALRAEGRDVVAFTAGELDFAPPPAVADAVAEALARGETRYTPTAGTPTLRAAVAERLERDLGQPFAPEQVVVSCGAKHSIYNLVQVLCDRGDQVLIPAPYWLSYLEMVRLAEGEPVICQTRAEAGFKLEPGRLDAALNDRTRLLFLNTPSNPTGAVYTRPELEAIAGVLRGYPGVVVIADEIYDKLVYGDATFTSLLTVAPDLRDRIVVVNGVSKTYAMTGFRIGWAAGPLEVMDLCQRLQSHSTSGPTSVSQAAAECALLTGDDTIAPIVSELEARRAAMVGALEALPGVTIRPPDGAFYCFPSVEGLLGRQIAGQRIDTPLDLANLLLDQAELAVVPGEPFGAPQNLRLSFALAREDLVRGLGRLEAFLHEHLDR